VHSIYEDKRRLSDMVLRLYKLVGRLLSHVMEGEKSSLGRVEELSATAEEYRNIISKEAVLLIARYQPLAGDLLWAESVISVAYDLYRVARYAREIAILSNYIGGLKGNVNDDVLESLEVAKAMLELSVEAFAMGRGELVEEVVKRDGKVDDVYHRYLALLSKGEPLSARDAASLLLARHVERIADHATYIAMSASRIARSSL